MVAVGVQFSFFMFDINNEDSKYNETGATHTPTAEPMIGVCRCTGFLERRRAPFCDAVQDSPQHPYPVSSLI